MVILENLLNSTNSISSLPSYKLFGHNRGLLCIGSVPYRNVTQQSTERPDKSSSDLQLIRRHRAGRVSVVGIGPDTAQGTFVLPLDEKMPNYCFRWYSIKYYCNLRTVGVGVIVIIILRRWRLYIVILLLQTTI